MQYRTLGKTAIEVSVVGIETHQWSGMGGKFFAREDVQAILERAQKFGINFIDTGECYFFHAAERVIGEALGSSRKKFIIATKFGHTSEPERTARTWTAEGIKKSLDDSLRALKTDYIDIYELHINSEEDLNCFEDTVGEVAKALKQAKDDRIIRSIGICLGDNELFDKKGKILEVAIREVGVESVEVVYNRLHREAETGVLPMAQKYGLGVIARVPLAKGYLSSRFKPSNKNYDARLVAEVENIKKKEVPEGVDIAEWAINWCIKNPAVASVIPGCSAPEQLDSTCRALNL
ncbi:MAG: aldo/keto reductase [bacterium]|nr:aldo/keto reductase [bacterium]